MENGKMRAYFQFVDELLEKDWVHDEIKNDIKNLSKTDKTKYAQDYAKEVYRIMKKLIKEIE